MQHFAPNSNTPDTALPPTSVLSLTEWKHGEMFVGTTFGLYRTNADGTQVTRVTLRGRDPAAGTRMV